MKHNPVRVAKDLCRKGVYYPPGSIRACEGTSADENPGKSCSWLVGQMFLCHVGLLEASDPKWSCNFQKPEVTTVCMSAPFCCCHSSKTNLVLNALSLGITQIPKPHLSHDQWWVCSSIVRSKPLQNTKTYVLHIFSTLFCVNSKIFFCFSFSPLTSFFKFLRSPRWDLG